MNRVLTTILAVALLLGLGGLAVLAMPGGNATLAAAPFVSAAPPAQEVAPDAVAAPDAPMADMYNLIALPLNASASIIPFKASGLAAYQAGTKQVLRWDAGSQRYQGYTPGISPPFADFDLALGGSYFLLLGASTNVFSIVGGVPEVGEVSFALSPGTATVCSFNAISVPLNRDDITNASHLATAIGGVAQVLTWDAVNQRYKSYTPVISPPFADFGVQMGYPYLVCLNNAAPTQWP